jgi:hypothetical protein
VTSDGEMSFVAQRLATGRQNATVVEKYVIHPESKKAGPDGLVVDRHTSGLLQRRHVEASGPIVRIGKESNKLDERLEQSLMPGDEYQVQFEDPENDGWVRLVLPTLRTINVDELDTATSVHQKTIVRTLASRTRPHRRSEEILTHLAVDHARKFCSVAGGGQSNDNQTILNQYLQGINSSLNLEVDPIKAVV